MSKISINDQSGDKKYFTIIPNYIYNHSTIWDREVYCQMKRIAGENGKCWCSQEKLSKQCGISINRLKKSLKYLIEHEWIKKLPSKKVKTFKGEQFINCYSIADLWRKNIEYYEKGVSPEDTPKQLRGVTDEIKGCHENNQGVSPEGYKEEPLNNNHTKEYIATDVASVKEFNYEETLNNWITGKNQMYYFIGWLFQKKGLKYETREQMNSAAKRHLRAAKALVVFSDEQINEAYDKMLTNKNIGNEWTLETIYKYLTK